MRKVTSKDGTAIAFEQSGNGPAVILVGGVLGDRSQQAPLATLLAEHFTVFNYDRRGHGESGDTPPYAVAREIEDLETLIKEAGGSAFVYGTSGCAILALEARLAASPPRSRSWRCGNHHTSSTTVVLRCRRITRRSSPSCYRWVGEATWWNSS